MYWSGLPTMAARRMAGRISTGGTRPAGMRCAPGRWQLAGREEGVLWTQRSFASVLTDAPRANLAFVCNHSERSAMRFLDFVTVESYDLRMVSRVLMAIVLVAASAGPGLAQSLADVAKAEAARRKSVEAPVKVYTNDDLKSDFTKPASAPASTPATAGTPAEGTAAATPAASGQAANGPA